MSKLSLKEAVRLWVDRDFSSISTELIKKAYKDNPEELELLSSEYPELDWPAGWGSLFHPDNRLDEEWIRNNIDIVESIGFSVYDAEETGILLGVDGMGYCFFDAHWTPLYKARGLHWHSEDQEATA